MQLKNGITYTINRFVEYNHLKLEIEIWGHNKDGYKESNFTLSWSGVIKYDESDTTFFRPDGTRRWYAFNIDPKASTLSDVVAMTKTLKKILGGIFDNWQECGMEYDPTPYQKKTYFIENTEFAPMTIIKRLEMMRNAHRVTYDGRVNDYVSIKDVMPSNVHVYRDDYKSPLTSWSNCQVSCLAKSPQEAKALLLSEFARHIQDDYNKEEWTSKLSEWVKAGQPVIMGNDHANTWQDVKEILA